MDIFTEIAADHLNIRTLEERGLDALDFHDCSVTSIRKALTAAYDAGRKAQPPMSAILAALADMLGAASTDALSASAAMSAGNQNLAMGTVIDFEGRLTAALSLYRVAQHLHRAGK